MPHTENDKDRRTINTPPSFLFVFLPFVFFYVFLYVYVTCHVARWAPWKQHKPAVTKVAGVHTPQPASRAQPGGGRCRRAMLWPWLHAALQLVFFNRTKPPWAIGAEGPPGEAHTAPHGAAMVHHNSRPGWKGLLLE